MTRPTFFTTFSRVDSETRCEACGKGLPDKCMTMKGDEPGVLGIYSYVIHPECAMHELGGFIAKEFPHLTQEDE